MSRNKQQQDRGEASYEAVLSTGERIILLISFTRWFSSVSSETAGDEFSLSILRDTIIDEMRLAL